jgi:phosphoribosylglycinamide formyltransferase 1
LNNAKKIVVLVSGGGTNLQALINAQNAGELGCGKISCVISSKADAYALTRAENAGIKTRVIIRKDYADIASYSLAIRDALIEEGADLVVYAGFMIILDESVYQAFPNKMINVHPALIPSFCGKGYYGLHVHEEALKKGVKVSGATVHFVTAECDAGPIILQKAVDVADDDTPETLQRRIMEQAEWQILPRAVRLFCEDRISVENGIVRIKQQEG